MTNLACTVLTPIKLASWGHIAEMCNSVRQSAVGWHFSKAAHEAAYKQLPLLWEHISLAVISLRPPTDDRWYGFMSRSMVFGAISAGLHYNISPRLIAELICRICGIPMLSYFEDIGSRPPPVSLAKTGLGTFSTRFLLMGITLKPAKSAVVPHVTFLGS